MSDRIYKVVIHAEVILGDEEGYPGLYHVDDQILLDLEADPAAFVLDQLNITLIEVQEP